MKRIGVTLAALFIFALPTFAQDDGKPKTKQDSTQIKEVLELDQNRLRYMREADTVGLRTILADEFIGTSPRGETRTKEELLDEIATGTLRFDSLNINNADARIYNGFVLVFTDIGAGANDRGRQHAYQTKHLSVYAYRKGRWQLIAHQATIVPEEDAE